MYSEHISYIHARANVFLKLLDIELSSIGVKYLTEEVVLKLNYGLMVGFHCAIQTIRYHKHFSLWSSEQ